MGQRVEKEVRLNLGAQQRQLRLSQSALQGLLSVLYVGILVLSAQTREHCFTHGPRVLRAPSAINPEHAVKPRVHRLAGDEQLASRRAIG